MCTYHSKILKWSGLFNVLESLLQISQLLIDYTLSLFCALDGLGLECLNRLNLPIHVVCLWLETIEALLDLVDDSSVLEDRSIVAEVDGLRLFREDGDLAARIIVALLERLKSGGSITLEA
jgi:hypothetical protein